MPSSCRRTASPATRSSSTTRPPTGHSPPPGRTRPAGTAAPLCPERSPTGSRRSLGLANTTPPNFLTAPGQVAFTPDGRQLIVTTKASTSSYEVFAVQPNGRLSAAPVVTRSATPVPFAFTFGPDGRLVAGE